MGRCSRMIKNWTLLNKLKEVDIPEAWAVELAKRSARLPTLPWKQRRNSRSLASETEDLTVNNNVSVLGDANVIHALGALGVAGCMGDVPLGAVSELNLDAVSDL
jgi:hypothetical protein